jgi:prepilin-type N-terminal cleavage/methylation domain-containing protein
MKINNKGFTLIELLVVISIIGMMSSVVLAAVNSARDKAKVAAARKFDTATYRSFGADTLGSWNFDEGGSGSTFFDSSGNNKDGIGTGVTRISNGAKGFGVNFANPADPTTPTAYITAPAISSLDSTDITVSAWINYADSQRAQRGWIVGSGVNTNWQIFIAGTILRWRTVFTNPVTDLTCILPKGDVWHHVLATQTGVAGSVKAQLYIDGVLCSESSPTLVPQPVAWSNSIPISIGRYYNGFISGYGFIGSIDEVNVYNKYLLALDVQNIYAKGLKKYMLAINK